MKIKKTTQEKSCSIENKLVGNNFWSNGKSYKVAVISLKRASPKISLFNLTGFKPQDFPKVPVTCSSCLA